MLAAALAALVAGTAFVVHVPAEPGTAILSEAATYQAVASDLDADGAREVVGLVAGSGGAIDAVAWGLRDGAWQRLGEPVEVVPATPTGEQGSVEWTGAPIRLVVRSTATGERVTLVRQPRFEEPDLRSPCCLLLDDVTLVDDALRVASVASPGDAADAVIALDLDGDGVDELLAARSLTPLGDIGFPTELRVFRWGGRAFAAPTISEINVGSGDNPFVLGDSDGVPGEEAAIIATIGRPAFYRLSLEPGDTLRVEDAGVIAGGALAVPTDEGRGLAFIDPSGSLRVHAWPRSSPLGPALGEALVGEGELLGVVDIGGSPHLALVHRRLGTRFQVLGLPALSAPLFGSTGQTPAAARFENGPVQPYVGLLPGGGPDGEATVVYRGRLVPALDDDVAPIPSSGTPTAALPGARPIGLVGPERGWLAVLHAPVATASLDPAGGRLDAPVRQPASGITVAPVAAALAPEEDDGALSPPLAGAEEIGPRGILGVGPDGFSARLEAPPGSRVHFATGDPSLVGPIHVVPPSGEVEVPLPPPDGGAPVARYRAVLAVTTPAGHGYLAAWEARVLAGPPPLEAVARTPLGSSRVEVSGRTVAYAAVTVAGAPVAVGRDGSFRAEVELPPWPTAVEVAATDPIGNGATTSVVGVGFLDYRALPWIGIAAVLVAVVALVLFLRVPAARPALRRTDDDAALEELEPD